MNEEITSSGDLSVQADILASALEAETSGDASSPAVEVTTTEARPFLTTSFENYTVSEGLLLMLLLLAVVMICVKMVKGGFSWL